MASFGSSGHILKKNAAKAN